LFYVARDGRLTAVPLQLTGANRTTVEAGAPVPLFQTHSKGMPLGQVQYAVSSDGQRFLINALIEDDDTSPIRVILNWKPKWDSSCSMPCGASWRVSSQFAVAPSSWHSSGAFTPRCLPAAGPRVPDGTGRAGVTIVPTRLGTTNGFVQAACRSCRPRHRGSFSTALGRSSRRRSSSDSRRWCAGRHGGLWSGSASRRDQLQPVWRQHPRNHSRSSTPIRSAMARMRSWLQWPRECFRASSGSLRINVSSDDPPPRESVGSVCTCEQLVGTSASYACPEVHHHERKPSPHRHPSASTSGEKAEQAARADCGSAADRTGCARSKVAANLFIIPLDDEREIASNGGLARWLLGRRTSERSLLSNASSMSLPRSSRRSASPRIEPYVYHAAILITSRCNLP